MEHRSKGRRRQQQVPAARGHVCSDGAPSKSRFYTFLPYRSKRLIVHRHDIHTARAGGLHPEQQRVTAQFMAKRRSTLYPVPFTVPLCIQAIEAFILMACIFHEFPVLYKRTTCATVEQRSLQSLSVNPCAALNLQQTSRKRNYHATENQTTYRAVRLRGRSEPPEVLVKAAARFSFRAAETTARVVKAAPESFMSTPLSCSRKRLRHT